MSFNSVKKEDAPKKLETVAIFASTNQEQNPSSVTDTPISEHQKEWENSSAKAQYSAP
jgi:hypothetical protein